MFFYGYALYYKDQDGYEIPLFHRHAGPSELVLVTPYKDIADRWCQTEHDTLKEELNPKARKVTTGYLWWKREYTERPEPLEAHAFRFKAQVFNTLFVKKVKLV